MVGDWIGGGREPGESNLMSLGCRCCANGMFENSISAMSPRRVPFF
jgi:hypothetical protein